MYCRYVHETKHYLTRKINFFEERSWFKLNDLGLALGMTLSFHTSVAKGLKLKVRKFWGLIPTFVEVKGEELVGDLFAPTPSFILNRVKVSRTDWNVYFIILTLLSNQLGGSCIPNFTRRNWWIILVWKIESTTLVRHAWVYLYLLKSTAAIARLSLWEYRFSI